MCKYFPVYFWNPEAVLIVWGFLHLLISKQTTGCLAHESALKNLRADRCQHGDFNGAWDDSRQSLLSSSFSHSCVSWHKDITCEDFSTYWHQGFLVYTVTTYTQHVALSALLFRVLHVKAGTSTALWEGGPQGRSGTANPQTPNLMCLRYLQPLKLSRTGGPHLYHTLPSLLSIISGAHAVSHAHESAPSPQQRC